MAFRFERHPANPIVWPGEQPWRRAVTFNPGVLLDDDGRFYLYERAAGQLRPFYCYIGMLESDDGVRFKMTREEPVFTPEMAGSAYGSVQDPRVAKLDGRYWMTYAYRPFAWESHPTGIGVPDSFEPKLPGFDGDSSKNLTRSGLAVSDDRVTWKHFAWITPADIDDRDVILFPEKIDDQYVVLRRPRDFVGPKYGTDYPSIWLSRSPDLRTWSDPVLVAKPAFRWEDNRIGGSTPPIKTARGWLVLYHGVENQDPKVKRVCYRLGAMLLDLHDPTKIVARAPHFVMEPETYYEKFGLYIPNVIFPTANVVKDGTLMLYYGVCDTAIALATCELDELVEHVWQTGR